MVGERQANWIKWKASAASFGLADLISDDGNRWSAPFAKAIMWLEKSRARWFPREFRASADAE